MAAFYEDEMEEDQQTFDEHESNYMNESRSMISRMITQNQNNIRFMLPHVYFYRSKERKIAPFDLLSLNIAA